MWKILTGRMSKRLLQSTLREIRNSLGRYIAIMAIIAIGVGFFAGLKNTQPDMLATIKHFYEKTNFHDYRLVSTIGFDKESVDAIAQLPECNAACGSIVLDALVTLEEGRGIVMKVHSLTETVDALELVAGRYPQNPNECVLDSYVFSDEMLGQTIVLAENNEEELLEKFVYDSFTVVGMVTSPVYIQYERGNTPLGRGVVDAYMLIPEDAFDMDYYTEIDVKLNQNFELYDDAYKNYVDEYEETYKSAALTLAQERTDRFNDEIREAKQEVEDARAQIEDAKAQIEEAKKQIEELEKTRAELEEAAVKLQPYLDMGYPLPPEQMAVFTALEQLPETPELPEIPELPEEAKEVDELEYFEEPQAYVLGRDTNIGYVCFESDSGIVDGIANVFPIFFFAVAALVCVTTMNRMVEEQRTQIGVLKALGYGDGAILFKYLFYAGSAALIGCVGGYCLGTWMFPKAIWYAYGMMYNAGPLVFVFSWKLAVISLVVAMLCSMGITFLSCRVQLTERAAMLMRPKAPKAGKRIFLEYIPFLWNHIGFLKKVSFRNIFRYKRRFFMMVLGISGCTALLIAGFGIKDSIAGVANMQYDRVAIYDMGITTKDEVENEFPLLQEMGYTRDDYFVFAENSMDLVTEEGSKSLYVATLTEDKFDQFYSLHTLKQEPIAFPKKGEAVVNCRMAEQFHLSVGDQVILRTDALQEIPVTISGINENFVYNYVYIAEETYVDALGKAPQRKNIYLKAHEGEDVREVSASILESEDVATVSVNEETRERINTMMVSMNIIVYIVIACAAALAFVVLYNLTNINITERIREIATIKVLGFFQRETCAYVFRENLILAVIGAFVGLPLGKLLHAFIMANIRVDLITFAVYVKPISYIFAFLFTVVFAALVNFSMGGKLDRVNMTESLKSVD